MDAATIEYHGTARDGSWWVYVDGTGATDSVHLSNYSHGAVQEREEACEDVETVSYALVGQGVLCGAARVVMDARTQIDLIHSNDSLASRLFNYSLIKNEGGGYNYGREQDFDLLAEYDVRGIRYSNVIKTYKGPWSTADPKANPTEIRYFAPAVGLIKFESFPTLYSPDSVTVELMRSNIVR